jgi:hypothetical protein
LQQEKQRDNTNAIKIVLFIGSIKTELNQRKKI